MSNEKRAKKTVVFGCVYMNIYIYINRYEGFYITGYLWYIGNITTTLGYLTGCLGEIGDEKLPS